MFMRFVAIVVMLAAGVEGPQVGIPLVKGFVNSMSLSRLCNIQKMTKEDNEVAKDAAEDEPDEWYDNKTKTVNDA